MSRPVASYSVEYGVSHNVLNNAIRDGFRGKPWGLKACKVPWGNMYSVEQSDFDVWYARYQQNRQKRKKETMQKSATPQATRDQIILSIHVRWERGWIITPESVREGLQIGQHVDSSIEEIESVIRDIVVPGAKEDWLKHFNQESEWNKSHPAPWDIEDQWKHQQIEVSAS